jgi:hypothetical protein
MSNYFIAPQGNRFCDCSENGSWDRGVNKFSNGEFACVNCGEKVSPELVTPEMLAERPTRKSRELNMQQFSTQSIPANVRRNPGRKESGSIWKWITAISAGTFVFAGISVLADPNCVSANFTGGRAVVISCRSDSYGSMSGSSAGLISVFVGLALLVVAFWGNLRKLLLTNHPVANETKFPVTNSSNSYDEVERLGRLLDANLISKDEFQTLKKRVLGIE